MKKYFIKTFGCQMNVSDSERIAGFLEKNDLKPASKINEADLVVFNTCGVRQMAENRAYGQIHNLKKNNPNIKIILTGCLANRKDVQRRLKNKVDLFFPISDFILFENFIIENCLEIGDWKLEISAQKDNALTKESIAYLSIKPKITNTYQAFVPIMSGCNNFCSYCIVPYARGRETSRPAEEILDEIRGLVEKGYKSITLLGQNVNSYDGKLQNPNYKLKINSKPQNSKNKNINFSQLLRKINAIPGNFWIYFVSSHPKDMSDELIEIIAKSKKVCEMVHLPIQSGSDEVLEKMNRKYTAAHYMGLVRKIKSAFKKHKPETLFALTSDIIVGFPGETKKQFLESAVIMEKANYDMVFFGQYSPRPGTAAWKLKDNVSKIEKARREKYLNVILTKTALANNKKYLEKTLEVLVENEKNGVYFGKTRTLKNVKIISKKNDLIGKIIPVKIIGFTAWHLEGEVI